jgi:hypothetical protein
MRWRGMRWGCRLHGHGTGPPKQDDTFIAVSVTKTDDDTRAHWRWRQYTVLLRQIGN